LQRIGGLFVLCVLSRVEDIGKMAFFKEIRVQEGKAVVIWIRGHQAFAANFSKLTSKSLLLPGSAHISTVQTCITD